MAPKNVRRSVGRRKRVDPEVVRAQILDAFSNKAKRMGIRALLMTELAAELRMSATTLYKLYPSKEALAQACVDRWVDELGAAEAAVPENRNLRDGFERFMHWVDAWADANSALSPTFANDLRTDYPAVWKRLRDALQARKRRGASLLRPLLRADVSERVAFALLDSIFSIVLKPDFADRLHISRRDALRSAVSIWAGGALERQRKPRTLRAVRTSTRP
jgi:AcrR family transcriptional regulator